MELNIGVRPLKGQPITSFEHVLELRSGNLTVGYAANLKPRRTNLVGYIPPNSSICTLII